MASAKKKAEAEMVPGTEESMPGMPGPADVLPPQEGDSSLDPLAVAPSDLEPPNEVEPTKDGTNEKRDGAPPNDPPASPSPPPAAPASSALVRCKVWLYGSLNNDGVLYAAGQETLLPSALVDALECLEALPESQE